MWFVHTLIALAHDHRSRSPWSGNVQYTLPVSLFPDLYYISVEPIQKKDENLRVMNPLQIVERVSNWQDNPTQIFETPLSEVRLPSLAIDRGSRAAELCRVRVC